MLSVTSGGQSLLPASLPEEWAWWGWGRTAGDTPLDCTRPPWASRTLGGGQAPSPHQRGTPVLEAGGQLPAVWPLQLQGDLCKDPPAARRPQRGSTAPARPRPFKLRAPEALSRRRRHRKWMQPAAAGGRLGTCLARAGGRHGGGRRRCWGSGWPGAASGLPMGRGGPGR